jgi:hypothetical protein
MRAIPKNRKTLGEVPELDRELEAFEEIVIILSLFKPSSREKLARMALEFFGQSTPVALGKTDKEPSLPT